MYWSLIFSFDFIDCGCVLGTHLFVATRSVHDIYHWQELPQVSFLSRQTCVCHDKRCVLCLSRQPRREFGDVSCHPPVWNLRAVIRFPFPISSLGFFLCLVLLLFLSCNFSANGPFPNFFPENSQSWAFLYGSCRAARRWKLVVACAACCCMALCFYNIFDCFHPFLFLNIFLLLLKN